MKLLFHIYISKCSGGGNNEANLLTLSLVITSSSPGVMWMIRIRDDGNFS